MNNNNDINDGNNKNDNDKNLNGKEKNAFPFKMCVGLFFSLQQVIIHSLPAVPPVSARSTTSDQNVSDNKKM